MKRLMLVALITAAMLSGGFAIATDAKGEAQQKMEREAKFKESVARLKEQKKQEALKPQVDDEGPTEAEIRKMQKEMPL